MDPEKRRSPATTMMQTATKLMMVHRTMRFPLLRVVAIGVFLSVTT
jgi:hypothetical protein